MILHWPGLQLALEVKMARQCQWEVPVVSEGFVGRQCARICLLAGTFGCAYVGQQNACLISSDDTDREAQQQWIGPSGISKLGAMTLSVDKEKT